ncbi:MiaB/RimO family radical SAM methylthiotransferase [Lachnotalea glycerini]|nr:MiaB/RimO family radical SAM methylthiotransferase [Lachnotalea glycerini]
MAKLKVYLRANGYELTNKKEESDYIVVTSCGFINETAKMALDEIESAKKISAEIIVTGCVPDTDVDKLKSIFTGTVIRNTELEKFDDIFGKFHKLSDIQEVHDMTWGDKYFCVEVSRGCPENCSYCATKWAVGKLHSKTVEECVTEVEAFNESDADKVVINGDNVGAYGLDIKESFATLLTALPFKENSYSALIDSLHPKWLLKYYDSILEAAKKNKLGMIVSAIQAGSERIIDLMNRKVDVHQLKEAYIEIKKYSPDIILGTEVIVGFPTETESEFMESVAFILDTKFDWGHIFAFSPKDGTKAAAMSGQIEQQEKMRRIDFFISQLGENGYVVHKEEKSQAVIFCKKEVCLRANTNDNVYWQHCLDTICPDRSKQSKYLETINSGV